MQLAEPFCPCRLQPYLILTASASTTPSSVPLPPLHQLLPLSARPPLPLSMKKACMKLPICNSSLSSSPLPESGASWARELMDWLHSMHRSMVNATPEDLLVFSIQHWLPSHAGSTIQAGKLIAAPTSLASAKSHLAKEFDLQGRTGAWTPAPSKAIPCTAFRSQT